MTKIVDTFTKGYPLIEGKPFTEYNADEEFVHQMDKHFSGMCSFEVVSRKGAAKRNDALLRGQFISDGYSTNTFYVYAFILYEGGAGRGHDDELRTQLTSGSGWSVDLSTIRAATNYKCSEDLTNKECYCIGIYKQNEDCDDVLFVGMPAEHISKSETESINPTSAFQTYGEKAQIAYNNGMYLHQKDFRASQTYNLLLFKPEYLFWYMKHRDELHVKDIENAIKVLEDAPQLNYSNINKSFGPLKGSFQQIYYGAPGTGKSHKTDEVAALYDDTVRTTFHPDSDYSTFVGAYKPVMRPENCFGLNQDSTVELTYPANHVKQGQPIPDNKIEYKFVKQAFLKAYVRAWKKFLGQEAGEIAPQFLVIEEINRGNCAQIFGDLFQLLDRKNGFSEYPIESDEDIKNALLEDGEDSFGKEGLGLTEAWIKEINAIIGKGNDVANKIAKGEVLVLPCNLYIWATMNTSDQSLFPIDSAFKRRWDWKYMRIKDAGKNWVVDVDYTDKDGNKKPLLWWDFLEAINEQIYNTTKSEDKQLGYFFCKATKKANEDDKEPTIITPETFVGKVIFYLWQDVFKATGFRSEIFKYKKNDRDCTIKFHDFYDGEADEATNPEGINKELLATFVANVMKAQ